MRLMLLKGGGARIDADTPQPLGDFERHLEALQDLISFAADRAAERTSLTAIGSDGTKVKIYGRTRYAVFGKSPRQPVE